MTFQFYTRRKWAICGGLGFEDLTLMKNISCYTFNGRARTGEILCRGSQRDSLPVIRSNIVLNSVLL